MAALAPRLLEVEVPGSGRVSALWLAPSDAIAVLVLAHGAGAGMTHKGMTALAEGLAARRIATLRFQFPYMERGSKRPDAPAVAHAAVRAAAAEAARLEPGMPLFAGGRSFGGRMTSQAQALAPLAGVRGLVFFAFPLHPAKKPSDTRAAHLRDVSIPMLFVQGSRDDLADMALLRPVLRGLGARASLHLIDDADHSFHVPARSGKRDADVLAAALDAVADWMRAAAGPPSATPPRKRRA